MKKFLEKIKNKWLIKGTTTLLLVAIIIACYVLLNWGVKKINVEDLDFTEKKLYTLSTETKDKLKDLKDDITIQLINMKDYSYVTEYAEKYEKISDKVKIENVDDLSARADLMTKYNLGDTDSLVVVKTGDKETTITLNDMYTYDYSSGEGVYIVEEALTNAIVGLTLEEKPKIYILSGNTYYDPTQFLSTLTQKLKDESNEVKYLDIMTKGEIPSDCSCLIITTLNSDLMDLEKDKIIEYIKNGGKIMMLTSQNLFNKEMPNLNTVLAEYGVKMGYGIVFEQDTDKMLYNSPELVIADVKASFMSDMGMQLKACLLDAGKIEFEDEDKLSDLGVMYEALISTSDKAFVRTNINSSSASKTSEDSEEGSSIIGALVTKTIDEDKKSELIIYANEIFATDMPLQIMQYSDIAINFRNNEDIILNSISHLTKRTDTITIRKTGENEKYTVTEKQDKIIKTIIFAVPLIIIAIGIIVWQIRRRSGNTKKVERDRD